MRTLPIEPQWKKFRRGSEVHVVPVGDIISHNYEDCVCGVETEPIPREDGSMGWLITHHSLDGREHYEKIPRKHNLIIADPEGSGLVVFNCINCTTTITFTREAITSILTKGDRRLANWKHEGASICTGRRGI